MRGNAVLTRRQIIDQIVPGGLRGTDHIHRKTNDNTCSRCREDIDDDEVPLMLWSQDGENLLIFCEECLKHD